MIYVAHPFGGKEENKKEVERVIKYLSSTYPTQTFVSPIHSFGFMYDDVSYDVGMKMCFDLLDACEMMFVYGDYESSVGCTREIQHCKTHSIPYVFLHADKGGLA